MACDLGDKKGATVIANITEMVAFMTFLQALLLLAPDGAQTLRAEPLSSPETFA